MPQVINGVPAFRFDDFILLGEFCEIVGPVATSFAPPTTSSGTGGQSTMSTASFPAAAAHDHSPSFGPLSTSRPPPLDPWLAHMRQLIYKNGHARADNLDSEAALATKVYEKPRQTEWKNFAPRIDELLRSACNSLVMRTLTGDIVQNQGSLSSVAAVTIDALPWLSHPTMPQYGLFKDYTCCTPHVALMAAVASIPDACARGFTRTLCFVHVSEKPLMGPEAGRVAAFLRGKAADVVSSAETVHPREVATLRNHMSFVIAKMEDLDREADAAAAAAEGRREADATTTCGGDVDLVKKQEKERGRGAGGAPGHSVRDLNGDSTPSFDASSDSDASDPVRRDQKRQALVQYVSLPEHQRRRFVEEAQAIERRQAALHKKGLGRDLDAFPRGDLVRRLLKKGSEKLRPLVELLPNQCQPQMLRMVPDDTSEFVRGYKRTIERIAYCALCRLPACIVITGEYSALAESVVAVVTAIYGLDDAEDALHSNHEWPPTLGDFEECAVIKWTPPQSVAAATIALPTNVVRVTVDNSGVALSLAQGWIPADLVVNTSDLVGSGNSSAMTSPVPLSAHTKTSGVGGSVLPPQAAAAASIPPSSQSATSMRTIGGASAHLTDEVNPDDIVWELPKNSIIRATLHRAKDRAGIRSAMSVMTRYLAARARHAGMFASGDLMKTVCSVNLAPPELGKGPALWSPIFLLTQNTGSGSYGISKSNVSEPAWLVNCLRGQVVEMCAGGCSGSMTLPQPFTHKAGSTLCTREHPALASESGRAQGGGGGGGGNTPGSGARHPQPNLHQATGPAPFSGFGLR